MVLARIMTKIWAIIFSGLLCLRPVPVFGQTCGSDEISVIEAGDSCKNRGIDCLAPRSIYISDGQWKILDRPFRPSTFPKEVDLFYVVDRRNEAVNFEVFNVKILRIFSRGNKNTVNLSKNREFAFYEEEDRGDYQAYHGRSSYFITTKLDAWHRTEGVSRTDSPAYLKERLKFDDSDTGKNIDLHSRMYRFNHGNKKSVSCVDFDYGTHVSLAEVIVIVLEVNRVADGESTARILYPPFPR